MHPQISISQSPSQSPVQASAASRTRIGGTGPSFVPGGDSDPDHHLWRNGRLWWVAFTVHLPSWQKERVRLSLGTDDVLEARRRRDQVLREYPAANGCELSLRIDGRKVRRPLSRSPHPGMAA